MYFMDYFEPWLVEVALVVFDEDMRGRESTVAKVAAENRRVSSAENKYLVYQKRKLSL